MANYGYVRISSKDQNLARQLAALKNYPLKFDNIFSDVMSGKNFDRPGYTNMISAIEQHDVIVIESIDRLGRNYVEILENWRLITKEKLADIVVIDMPLLDTRTKDGDLMGLFVSDLVLQILSYVAQTERDFIRRRQAEGIAAAKAAGVKFGRPRLSIPSEYYTTKKYYLEKKISSREAAKILGVSQTQFLTWTKNF